MARKRWSDLSDRAEDRGARCWPRCRSRWRRPRGSTWRDARPSRSADPSRRGRRDRGQLRRADRLLRRGASLGAGDRREPRTVTSSAARSRALNGSPHGPLHRRWRRRVEQDGHDGVGHGSHATTVESRRRRRSGPSRRVRSRQVRTTRRMRTDTTATRDRRVKGAVGAPALRERPPGRPDDQRQLERHDGAEQGHRHRGAHSGDHAVTGMASAGAARRSRAISSVMMTTS